MGLLFMEFESTAFLKKPLDKVFTAMFLVIRILYWPWVSVQFWADILGMHFSKQGFHSHVAMVFFLLANTALTSLQFYWAFVPSAGDALKPAAAEVPAGSDDKTRKGCLSP